MGAPRPIRAQMGALSDGEATALLARYGGSVTRFVRRKYGWLGSSVDDLVQVAKVAICEAHVTFRESRPMTAQSWTWRVVRWRVDEAAALEQQQRERGGIPDQEAITAAVANGRSDPDHAIERQIVLDGMAYLEARETTVVNARLRAETFQEIGARLGISHSVAHRAYNRAVRQLQEYAEHGAPEDPEV